MEDYNSLFDKGKLIFKYLKDELDVQQKENLDIWLNESHANRDLLNRLTDEFYLSKELQVYSDSSKETVKIKLLKMISAGAVPATSAKMRVWPRMVAAAAIFLVIGAGLFYYSNSRHQYAHLERAKLVNNNIKPGGNKAYLTLANGQKLSLTDAANGNIANQAGIQITKTAEGQIIYTVRHTSEQINYSNTIETPRGGQYRICLPDGSKVWLNAASKLIYPVSFAGQKQRVVSLSGEAYFEIFKNKEQPFVVKSSNQEVTVLGTHFNVNSYMDEPDTKTTLLEGSVRISGCDPERFSSGSSFESGTRTNMEAILIPGQQSVLIGSSLKITQVNTELAVAWKNNQFMFESEPVESVMRRIARWYNVDIIYTGEMPTARFGGAVSRFENISEVLKALESTGKIHFRVEGQKIYVTK